MEMLLKIDSIQDK